MKAVLLSIQPKWCELIASGKKTVEVRKTKPKLETPFKVYIYCTKDNTFAEKTLRGFDDNGKAIYHKANKGKVIGEFVCRKIFYRNCDLHDYDTITLEKLSELSCVSEDDLLKYADGGCLYGWHISDLKIYDEPRELSEFKHDCNGVCVDTKRKIKCDSFHDFSCDGLKPLKRPPQSWMYVEVEG